jgi:hypothetical protein
MNTILLQPCTIDGFQSRTLSLNPKYLLIPFLLWVTFSSDSAMARSLKSTADRLGQEASQIGFGLALLGFAIGAIYLILGKQDAPTKITSTILGVLLLSASPTIIKFLKGIA